VHLASQQHDCPIDLKDDAIPQFKPLYNLTQPEMPGKDNEPADALSRSFEKESENKGSVLLREDCWKSVAAVNLAPITNIGGG
jgi:hypothetical protein